MFKNKVYKITFYNMTDLKAMLGLVFAAFFLTGCMVVGPNYHTPDLIVPSQWDAESASPPDKRCLDTEALANWWSTMDDPIMTSLIKRAQEGNLDIKKMEARLREARARQGISESGRFPTLDVKGSASLSQTRSSSSRELYNAGFDASWELDLFGGVKRSIEAAKATLDANEEEMRDVLVSLLAEVALNYVNVRSLQNRLLLVKSNLAAKDETYTIARWRFEAGLSSELDIEQAKSDLEQTRSQIPTLEIGLEDALNKIALLLGENPGSVREELKEPASIPVTSLEIAVGVPADTLRRIPSVRSAERKLAAQTAQVGVATTELYPKFTLIGSIGLEALSLSKLFSANSRTLRIGPNISWPLFDSGRIRQNIEVQNALQEQALIEYEEAILKSLQDVENALFAYAREQIRQQSLEDSLLAEQHALDLTMNLYAAGLIDFQIVLTAQRSLLSLQDQLVVSKSTITSNLIRLYKALGGGWQSMATNGEG